MVIYGSGQKNTIRLSQPKEHLWKNEAIRFLKKRHRIHPMAIELQVDLTTPARCKAFKLGDGWEGPHLSTMSFCFWMLIQRPRKIGFWSMERMAFVSRTSCLNVLALWRLSLVARKYLDTFWVLRDVRICLHIINWAKASARQCKAGCLLHMGCFFREKPEIEQRRWIEYIIYVPRPTTGCLLVVCLHLKTSKKHPLDGAGK